MHQKKDQNLSSLTLTTQITFPLLSGSSIICQYRPSNTFLVDVCHSIRKCALSQLFYDSDFKIQMSTQRSWFVSFFFIFLFLLTMTTRISLTYLVVLLCIFGAVLCDGNCNKLEYFLTLSNRLLQLTMQWNWALFSGWNIMSGCNMWYHQCERKICTQSGHHCRLHRKCVHHYHCFQCILQWTRIYDQCWIITPTHSSSWYVHITLVFYMPNFEFC